MGLLKQSIFKDRGRQALEGDGETAVKIERNPEYCHNHFASPFPFTSPVPPGTSLD